MDELLSDLSRGDFATARARFRSDASLLWRRHAPGKTHLHICANWGWFEAARFLLNVGHPAQVYDKDRVSPLHHACRRNDLQMATLLLEHGATADRGALFYAFNYGSSLALVVLLLQYGADPKVALHQAVECASRCGADLSIVDHLLTAGVDPNAPVDGMTTLHRLDESDNAELASRLVERGARVSRRSEHGQNALESLKDVRGCRVREPDDELQTFFRYRLAREAEEARTFRLNLPQ